MALTCKVGPSLSYDVVAYVRSQIEDDTTPFRIPDSRLSSYIEVAVEEYTRLDPIGELIVGNIASTPPSSPLQTQSQVARYSCTVGNGFTTPVQEITDVLYRASGVFTAASEIAYLALMPVSPLNWFRIDKDLLNSPSSRHIRDQYLQELDHYGIGYWGRVNNDGAGNKAIDIYPPPITAGLPIFVRYTAMHGNTPDGGGNPQYSTIPEEHKTKFAKLLYAVTLEEEAHTFTRLTQVKSGMITRVSSPAEARALARDMRETVELQFSGAVTQIRASY